MENRSLGADIKKVLESLSIPEQVTDTPALVMMSGLPGTGKSFLAGKIAARLPAVIVESDFIRKTLFPKPTYSGPESAWIHRIAHIVITRLLRAGHSVIYDAMNLSEWHREKAYRLAETGSTRLVIVRTTAPEAIIRRRLDRRIKKRTAGDSSDASWEIYERFKRAVDPIRRPHMVVNTGRALGPGITRILHQARPRRKKSRRLA